ncbi:hypothetical protein HY450_03705, partial [Candidatus Pacearchaeota archaeon]|nr:hypothetical protein [Candidatus Pacearchaeota archaeon]
MTDVEVMCEEGGLRERESSSFDPESCVVYRPKKKTKVDSVTETEANQDKIIEDIDEKKAEPVTISLSDRIIYEEKNDLEERAVEEFLPEIKRYREHDVSSATFEYVGEVPDGKGGTLDVSHRRNAGIDYADKRLNLDRTTGRANQAVKRLKREARETNELFRKGSKHTPSFAIDMTFEEPPHILVEYVPGVAREKAKEIGIEALLKKIGEIAEPIKLMHEEKHYLLDIKPRNFKVRENGEWVFVDLEAGRRTRIDDMTQTMIHSGDISSSVFGTLVYAAPEVINGEIKEGEEALADIYSLGATLYEFISGHQPGGSERLHEFLHVEESLGKEKAKQVSDLIARSMARETKTRPQSVDEFVSEMNEITGYREEN